MRARSERIASARFAPMPGRRLKSASVAAFRTTGSSEEARARDGGNGLVAAEGMAVVDAAGVGDSASGAAAMEVATETEAAPDVPSAAADLPSAPAMAVRPMKARRT